MNNKQNNKITSRDVDFAKWYSYINCDNNVVAIG